ncbi:MAG: replicative DNA helicase [Anaerovoracaceae bacterium]|jgi:replicative DNA helicase|nr:replicative DNA helicase [Anaerovoracaceae bacterium]
MIERIPPHNNEAEMSVLGAAMLSKNALLDIMEAVRSRDFYSEIHKEIFEVITLLYRGSRPIDTVTVAEELKKRNSLDMVGGRAYVFSLASGVPSTANAGEYGKIVAEKASLRNLIEASTEIIDLGYTEKIQASEAIDRAEQKILDIAKSRQNKDVASIREVLDQNLNTIDENSKMKGQVMGIPSGFADYDRTFGGFQKSELIIVAARPSMGKTSLALNIAQQAALKNKAKVLIFSLEMSKEQLGLRLLSMESRIESNRLKVGDLEGSEWEQLSRAVDTITKGEMFIDDTPGILFSEIKNKCRRLKAEKGLDLILIDYLQLMSFEGRAENRQQEITSLSRYMKQLAREMDCPVIVLSQLSRAPELRKPHIPILSDLRESGSIEQDADIVIFLYRDDYYNVDDSEKPGVCDLIIAKNRSGPTGKVELTWLSNYTKFVDKSNLGG